MMRRMFSGEPADSHSIQRTNSSEMFCSPRSDCTCSRTRASSRVPTWMMGNVHSRARVSHDDIGSCTTPSEPSLVTVPMTSSMLCLASETRKVKSSTVDWSAHCRSSTMRMSGEPPPSPAAERKPYMSCIDCTMRL